MLVQYSLKQINMSQVKPKTLSGFQDLLPEEAFQKSNLIKINNVYFQRSFIIFEKLDRQLLNQYLNSMKKFPFYMALLTALMILDSCSNTGNGELVGVRRKSKHFYQPDPYGMVFIPQGSFTMGTGDQDFNYSQLHQPKTVSVSPFYMCC